MLPILMQLTELKLWLPSHQWGHQETLSSSQILTMHTTAHNLPSRVPDGYSCCLSPVGQLASQSGQNFAFNFTVYFAKN